MIKELRHIQLHDMMSYLKAVVASLVLCFTIQGCDKEMGEPESTIDDNSIGFNAGVEKTRAVVGSISDVQNNGGFSVWGSYTNSDGTLQHVFNGENVYWSAGTWKYDATKYWNSGKTYSFFAVYPYPQNDVYYDNGYKLKFSVPSNADVDLMTATATETATKNSDGEYPTVGFDFAHALSMVNIYIKKNILNEEDVVTVRSVSLGNINLSGTYNSLSGKWENPETETFSCSNLNVVLPGTPEDAPTFKLVKGDLMFLPQEITENTIPLTISYTINSELNEAQGYLPVIVDDEGLTGWVEQKKYTYNITLGEVKSEILFNSPVVNDWKNEKPVGGSIIIQ